MDAYTLTSQTTSSATICISPFIPLHFFLNGNTSPKGTPSQIITQQKEDECFLPAMPSFLWVLSAYEHSRHCIASEMLPLTIKGILEIQIRNSGSSCGPMDIIFKP